MSIEHISKFQKYISIVLLFSILFIFSCSIDSKITNSTDTDTLNKPVNIYTDEVDEEWQEWLDDWGRLLGFRSGGFGLGLITSLSGPIAQDICAFMFVLGVDPSSNIKISYNIEAVYKFRDVFLLKSKKGYEYTVGYYALSKYGIENNLMLKYPLEHISIMETGINVSKELQHGTNNNKILINKSTYDDLRELTNIYRQSENHKDIEPFLDYLEADLEKYYNKPKAEIAADFGF